MTPLRLIHLAPSGWCNDFTKRVTSRMVATAITAVISLTVVLGTGLALPSAAWAGEEVRAVSGFQAVALEGAMTVKVARADSTQVQVSGSDRALALVETMVETREGVPTLVVRSRRSWFNQASDTVVQVQGPQFQALSVAGSGTLQVRLSNQPSLRLATAGSGELGVEGVTAHRIDVQVAGSGDVRVRGAAQNLTVSVAGSGDAWLGELEAEDVRVSVAGSGDARVNARQRLRASVAGSGDVRYRGPARDVVVTTTGSGTATRE